MTYAEFPGRGKEAAVLRKPPDMYFSIGQRVRIVRRLYNGISHDWYEALGV